MKRAFALLVVVLLAGTAAATTTTIDANHELASDQAIATYDSDGVASTNLTQLDMTVTVAENHEDAGVEGFYFDTGSTYLRLDYDEDIARTIRIYIPAEYFKPRVKQGLDPIDSGPDATLTPVNDNEMTAVTIEVSGQTDAVYDMNAISGNVWSGLSEQSESFENRTGWSLPSVRSSAGWEYINAGTYSASEPATINGTDMTLQYAGNTSTPETVWYPVRQCTDAQDQRVCYVEQDNMTVLTSTQDSPQVRYRQDGGLFSVGGSVVNDIRRSLDRGPEWFDGLFGGGA